MRFGILLISATLILCASPVFAQTIIGDAIKLGDG